MPKNSIHPEYYSNAKVYCDGQLVMKVGSTKPVLKVDIWSGTHPFYTGSQKLIDTEGRVERFMRKYGMASTNNENNSEKDKPHISVERIMFFLRVLDPLSSSGECKSGLSVRSPYPCPPTPAAAAAALYAD